MKTYEETMETTSSVKMVEAEKAIVDAAIARRRCLTIFEREAAVKKMSYAVDRLMMLRAHDTYVQRYRRKQALAGG